MPSVQRSAAEVVVFLLLSALFAYHVWYTIGPHLLYYQHCPVFLTGVDYFRSFLNRPSGPVEYVTLFLEQLTYYPWVGAVVIAVVAASVCLCARTLLNAMSDVRVHPSAYCLPGLLLLMLHAQYDYKFITSVSLLTSLACAAGYVRLRLGGTLGRLLVFAALSAALTWVAGGTVIVFGVVCGVFELARRRKTALGVACILLAAAAPWCVAWFSYGIGYAEAHAPLVPFRRTIVGSLSARLTVPGDSPLEAVLPMTLRTLLFLFFPAAMLWSAQRHRLSAWCRQVLRRPAAPTEAAAPQTAPGWSTLSLAIFLLVAIALVGWSFDADRKTQLEIGYHGERGDWEAVLRTAVKLPPRLHDSYVMHEVTKALYHGGLLAEKLFLIPQRFDADSLLLSGARSGNYLAMHLRSSAVWLELGAVNHAQRSAYIALDVFGERPDLLKRLVKINVVRGRPATARVYLHRLCMNPIHRRWAEEYLARLDKDEEGKWDDEVVRVRSRMLRKDYGWEGVLVSADQTARLERLLEEHRDNRMAFEYLMAHELLRSHVVKLRTKLGAIETGASALGEAVANLHRMDDLAGGADNAPCYTEMPRPYQEAVLVYESDPKNAHVDLGRWKVTDENRRRYDEFRKQLELLGQPDEDRQREAARTLRTELSTSYFFYRTFGFSLARPMKTLGVPDTITGATRPEQTP